jgi:hypothetical protein
MSHMQIVCYVCQKYTGPLDYRCVPEKIKMNRKNTLAKCFTCRERAVPCDWGNTIPKYMNGIKMKIHKEQVGTSSHLKDTADTADTADTTDTTDTTDTADTTDTTPKKTKASRGTRMRKKQKSDDATSPVRAHAKSSTGGEGPDALLQPTRTMVQRIFLEKERVFERLADAILNTSDS